jgi:DNA-binding GntR family transcriptional regulator
VALSAESAGPSLSDQAYRELLERIVSGELAAGTRLRDVDLAESLGMSRTPVREAVLQLQREGLVEVVPRAYSRVARIDTKALAEAVPVAATLQALAARLGAPAMKRDDVDRMRAADQERSRALAAGLTIEAIDADDRFHGVLVERAHNRELEAHIEAVMRKLRRLDYVYFSELDLAADRSDHEALIEACEARDPQRAAEVTERTFMELGGVLDRLVQAGLLDD